MKKYNVEKEIIIYDYLKEKLNNLSKNSIKNLGIKEYTSICSGKIFIFIIIL